MRIITSLSRFYYERIVCFTKSLAFPGKPPEISRGLPHQPSEDVIVRHEGRQRERRGRLLTRSAAVILEEEHATGQHYPFPSGGVRSRRTVALLRVEEKPTTLRVTTSCNRTELTPAPKKKKKKVRRPVTSPAGQQRERPTHLDQGYHGDGRVRQSEKNGGPPSARPTFSSPLYQHLSPAGRREDEGPRYHDVTPGGPH